MKLKPTKKHINIVIDRRYYSKRTKTKDYILRKIQKTENMWRLKIEIEKLKKIRKTK